MSKNILLLSLLIPFNLLFSSNTTKQPTTAQQTQINVMYMIMKDLNEELDEVKDIQKAQEMELQSIQQGLEAKKKKIENQHRTTSAARSNLEKTSDAMSEEERAKKTAEVEAMEMELNQAINGFIEEQQRLQQQVYMNAEQNAKKVEIMIYDTVEAYRAEHKKDAIVDCLALNDEINDTAKISAWANKKYKTKKEAEEKAKKVEQEKNKKKTA